jgi:HD-GYP domain-containing protein (c-di-GMP phosphodiesterase class II)
MQEEMTFSFNQLISELSFSLDLLTPDICNHHRRVTFIATQLAKDLGLGDEECTRLFYSAQLHDIGVVSSVDKLSIMKFDYMGGYTHCEKGKEVLQKSEYLSDFAILIQHHHDRWLGPNKSGLLKDKIPFISQIISLSDRLSVLITNHKYILEQKIDILNKINNFNGTFFNPVLVLSLNKIAKKDSFWLDLTPEMIKRQIDCLIPGKDKRISLSDIISIAHVFEYVIDCKSHFTQTHSQMVRKRSVELAKQLGFSEIDLAKIEIAASLHDLGKFSIPDEILDKPALLTDFEYAIIKKHSYYTYNILRLIDGFNDIAKWSAWHHERLDSSGYPFRQNKETIPLGSRIIAVADVFTALTEDRPYRSKLPVDQALRLIEQQIQHGILDGEVLAALKKIISKE